jgi:hypothetical protein
MLEGATAQHCGQSPAACDQPDALVSVPHHCVNLINHQPRRGEIFIGNVA